MNKDLVAIFDYLEREKGIKREVIIKAIAESLRLAAKKSVKGIGEVQVNIHPKTGDIEVVTQKKIVESVENPEEEISLEEALEMAPNCQVGQWLEILITPQDFGRIAAQIAGQFITQRLRGAERDVIQEEFRHRKGEIVSGTIKRFFRGKNIVVDLGKVEAILPERHYPRMEKYHIGEKIQALLWEVRDAENGGAEVILTRSHPEFVAELFKQEVPELNDGTVIIERMVRDAGYRTKIAVSSLDSRVDPVGTCVGVRGTRIKNVIRELNNEKIDIMPFSDDRITLLQNALSPVAIRKLKLDDSRILLIVADEDYPTVIGKRGMNARLLSQLIDKEIEVQKLTDYQKLITVQMAELADSENASLDQPLKIEGVSSLVLEGLIQAGYDSIRKVAGADPQTITKEVPGFSYFDIADKILEQTKK